MQKEIVEFDKVKYKKKLKNFGLQIDQISQDLLAKVDQDKFALLKDYIEKLPTVKEINDHKNYI